MSINTAVQVVVTNTGEPRKLVRRAPCVPAITINPERLGGTPSLSGTRLPVAALLDYLSDGGTIRQFVDEYEVLTEGDCIAALDYLKEAVETCGLGEMVDY